MKFSEILKLLRKKNHITQEQFAKDFNISKSAIAMYETDQRTPNTEMLEKIAQYFNVSLDYLITGKETDEIKDIFSLEGVEPIKTKKLPVLGSVACGKPIFADEEFHSYVSCKEDINADFCLLAKGDSMINAGIKDGSIVFVRKQPMVDNGQIAVVLIEDEATLKRVYFDNENKRLILNPENSAFAPIIIDKEQLQSGQVKILGKAVACQFKVR